VREREREKKKRVKAVYARKGKIAITKKRLDTNKGRSSKK